MYNNIQIKPNEELYDGWSSFGVPVSKSELELSVNENISDEQEPDNGPFDKRRKKRVILSPVLSFQLVISMLILTVAFIFKTFFFNEYIAYKEFYDKELEASMVFDGNIDNIDLSALFASTVDEY